MKVLDQVRFEQYAHVDPGEFGFGVDGQKALVKWMTVGGGFADIDAWVGTLNSDRFGRGRRVYGFTQFKLTPEMSVQTWLGRAVGDTKGLSNLTRFDAILEYDVWKGLTRAGVLK
jgi:hypothetical protein